MVKELDDDNFEQTINSDKITLVDFWAPWCGPCRQLAPTIEEVAREMLGKVEVCKINIDDNPESPSKYNIRSIPTLMLFKNGKPVATKIGSLPKTSLINWIDENS